MTKEEDDAIAERLQKDADGIILFVSPRLVFYTVLHTKEKKTVDWIVLCCRRGIERGHRPGSQAKRPGYVRILSEEDVRASSSRRFQCIPHIYPFHSGSARPLLSPGIHHRGELTLVLEPGYEP